MWFRLHLTISLLLFPLLAAAYPITSYLEMVKISNVSNAWQTIAVENTYTNPVVACTYNLPSSGNAEGSARVQLIGSSIQVKVQRPLNGAVTPSDVYCTISEAGSYTTPIKYEAHTTTSTRTNRNGAWNINRMINISSNPVLKTQNYTQPVIIGQVMSDNDPNFVTFWSNACNRTIPATNAAMCIGKHTAETDITTEFTETIGYFIAEQANYRLDNERIKIALGADTIRGVQNGAPHSYNLTDNYTYATATVSAMDGGDGGWAVFYGSNPVTTTLSLAMDEDTVRNAERSHTTEQIAYWVMEPLLPELKLQKTVATVYDPVNETDNPKSIPGAIIEYTLTVENTGAGAADNNSIVLSDLIPTNTKLCVANSINCLAPYFTDGSTNSGLSLSSTTYSDDNGTTYTYPTSADAEGADVGVTNLRSALNGIFAAQTGVTAPSFTLKFRVIVE